MRRTKVSVTHYCPNYKTEFSWVDEDKQCTTKAYCNVCKKSIDLSSVGKTALTSHAKGSKHNLKLKFQKESLKVDRFLTQNLTTEITAVVSASAQKEPSEGLSNALKDSGSMIKNFLTSDQFTRAEILWCLTTVSKLFSNRGAAEAVTMFADVFPDSEIAAKMKLQKDKIG
ncbi:uncharacterized protein LOC117178945 [Belonocnema kinseyi]|uniref:uncharacterized protein LOC117178945 n=1 Tax=Belonocnema kinseyi TaxID=2817044 RepID=UPI00143D86F4|nr:uncharacterized protein LOC117178945 [Belonocnema kinseyi]